MRLRGTVRRREGRGGEGWEGGTWGDKCGKMDEGSGWLLGRDEGGRK
jgi:hypothetical protein